MLGTREGLDHVVQNLVDNAVKYGGGTPVSVRATRLGTHVRIAVADAGPGIPKGFEERVFERFYRVDPGRSRARAAPGSASRSSRASSRRWAAACGSSTRNRARAS